MPGGLYCGSFALIIDAAQDHGLSVVPLFILMGLFVSKGGLYR